MSVVSHNHSVSHLVIAVTMDLCETVVDRARPILL